MNVAVASAARDLRIAMPPPSVEYVLPAEVTPAALSASLHPDFALEAEETGVVDRTYYDTFDGRVHRTGMTLVWERARLRLIDGDRELMALDWPRAGTSVRAADLPPDGFGARLASVIDIRAATPVARVRVCRRTFRVLDDERKTVVRLAIEEPSVAVPDGEPAQLATRLSAVGVRGYDKALRRVRRVMERELGLVAADEVLMDEAVARAGGAPGGISSKPDVELRPKQRADTAAAAILTRLTAVIEANLPGALADVDSEFLHDLRVAVRRTRSLLRELKGAFPPDALAHFRAEFRWLQEVTGPTRDLDVYVLEFDEFAATLPQAQRRDLEPLRALLIKRRGVERRRMVRALGSARAQTLLAGCKDLVRRLPDLHDDDRPDAARPVSTVAAKRIATVYRQMLRMGERIDDASPPAALHDLRKKAKELRYLLEFFAPLFPPETVGPMVKTLKALQDTLGRFQDREVQAWMLRSVGDEIAARENGAVALMAMGVLVERLETQQAEARAEFAQRFAPFAAKPRRVAVKETFR